MNRSDYIKLFGMSCQLAESDLDRQEQLLQLDLERDSSKRDDRDEQYYPQFEEAVRREAAEMGAHYEVFYCLEKSIRDLVSSKLAAEHGAQWWQNTVPQQVRDNVAANIQREKESAVTLRSTEEIDYTTFGQLGEIVRANWTTFGDTFNNERAFTKVMTSLNVLRGPIAHCSPLAPDEVVRLQLTVRDWFRLME